MIRIQRPAAPDILTARQHHNGREINSGPKETADASAFYSKASNRSKPYDFKMYRHETVKDRLVGVLGAKCAYCESVFQAVFNGDVEHWRPKNRVTARDGSKHRPGYYWLAASWENLLLACIHCNQANSHYMLPGSTTKTTLGKVDQFPIAQGSAYATNPGDEVNERPLLLDPCNAHDDPATHLEFDDRGDTAGVVKARKGRDGNPSEKAEVSIHVYGLNRPGLVHSRKEHLLQIQQVMLDIDNCLKELKKHPDNDYCVNQLGVLKTRLDAFLEPRAPYVQMARQAIRRFKRSRGLPG